jgi:hypothetical protein
MTLSNVTISGGTNNVTETLANVTTLNATSAFITTGNITTANVGNLTLLNALTVPNGGTGMVSLPANNVLLGNGTSPIASVAPGTVGNVLTSTGTGWVSNAVPGGGNAAPNTASYVLISSNANLTSGRVLTAGANVTITDNGPGNTIVINSSGGGGGGGSGTVTSVSVASANGLAGTVANATTTPAITLSTTVTGLLKGDGTAISAATANTDYQSPITLTTTGTSGAATFTSNTLNIPQYAAASGSGLTLLSTTTPTNGATTISITGLASSDYFLVIFADVSCNSPSASFRIALSSDNGSTYGTAEIFNSVSSPENDYMIIYLTNISGSVKVIDSPALNVYTSVTGVINAMRFSVSGSTTFDGSGKIYVYGMN